jgi:hypothetical protein
MRFKDLAGNPNFISGIYNYCDRWCERCHFTARCGVYAAEEADPDNDPFSRDISNAAFWQKLSSIFKETQEMISEWAEENGVDLSEEALAPTRELQEKQRKDTRKHPLAKAAEKYAFDVSEWFEKEFRPVDVISDLPPQSEDAKESEDDVNDYVEVVRWYQFFIAAKMIRGLMSRIDEDDYLAAEDPRDSDGSAKAALIAIDRSASAWKLMCDLRPENAESIHGLLFQLEKLRSGAEREFPNARDFIRPGFDEPTLDLLH